MKRKKKNNFSNLHITLKYSSNDIPAALKEFENCCLKYRATPWKHELSRKCIQSEDANALQRLTDLSTQIHGEVNSLYDLMLSFLECGRIKQAKKILEVCIIMNDEWTDYRDRDFELMLFSRHLGFG